MDECMRGVAARGDGALGTTTRERRACEMRMEEGRTTSDLEIRPYEATRLVRRVHQGRRLVRAAVAAAVAIAPAPVSARRGRGVVRHSHHRRRAAAAVREGLERAERAQAQLGVRGRVIVRGHSAGVGVGVARHGLATAGEDPRAGRGDYERGAEFGLRPEHDRAATGATGWWGEHNRTRGAGGSVGWMRETNRARTI